MKLLKYVNIFFALLLLSLWSIPVYGADPLGIVPFLSAPSESGAIKIGDSVFVSSDKGDIKVTPHTLYSSGWVTVEFTSKTLSGDVDISFGFNGVDQLQVVKAQEFEAYPHLKTKYTDVIETTTFQPKRIISSKSSYKTAEVGDSNLNLLKADVIYEDEFGKVVTKTVAYDSFDGKAYTYKVKGQKSETYQEIYSDWKENTNSVAKVKKTFQGAKDWQSVQLSQTTESGNKYTAKFWVEVPFGGESKVEGKYNVVVKPHGGDITSGVVLDPWYSSSWTYRNQLTCYGSSVATQTSYQKKIRVYYGSGTDTAENIAQYTTGDDTNEAYYGPYLFAQTFTAETSANVTKIWVKLNRDNAPVGSLMYSIRATAVGVPTGNDLCSGNITSTYISTTSDWYEFDMGAGLALTSGTVYALVGTQTSSTAGNRIRWRKDATGAYSGGSIYFYNAGWALYDVGASDFMFQIVAPPSVVGTRVYCNSLCQTDFDDLRFTASDGSTLLPYWIETKVDSSYADVWVKLDTIAQMTGTSEHGHYYMYYGNSGASSASNGTNTFNLYDNFDGAALDAAIWPSTAGAGSATVAGSVLTLTNQYYIGTSTTFASGYAIRTYTSVGVDQVGEQFMGFATLFSSTSARTSYRWTSTSAFLTTVSEDEGLNSSIVNTTKARDTSYHKVDVIRTGTTDLYGIDETSYDPGAYPVNTARVVQIYANTADILVDWVFVRKFAVSQPLWGVATARETLDITVTTLGCSGTGQNWAVLNGLVASSLVSSISQWGFDYGLTTVYGSSYTSTTTVPTGLFTGSISGLSASTVYHFRAKVYTGTWWYGSDMTFSTTGADVYYDYWTTGGNSDSYRIGSANVTYQTFTTNSTSLTIPHSVTKVKLVMKRVGTPGIVTASIRNTSNCTAGVTCFCYPSGNDLTSGTLDGATFSTSYTWYTFTMATETCLSANTTYAIVVSAADCDTSNYVMWQAASAGGYAGGNAGHSEDSGVTWTPQCTVDQLFEIWGQPCFTMIDAKVFTSYIEDGDWLICILYKNLYPPYYAEAEDVSQLFYLRLVGTDSTVIAQTKCPEWGYKPACIYLAADEVTGLQWGARYIVRLYGNFGSYVFTDYVLQTEDWKGSDLSLLDSWTRSTASLMETYYNTDLTTYIAERGICLNSTGGVIFANNIPELEIIRPLLFSITSTGTTIEDENFTHTYQESLVWQTAVGPQLTTAFTNLGNTVGIQGSTVGAIIGFIVYALVALFCFRPGNAIAAICIPLPILLIIFGTGLAELALMGILLAVAVLLLANQVWFKGG